MPASNTAARRARGDPSPPADFDRRAEMAERRRLLHDLREAIARETFVLHYQPRLSLAAGTVDGAEALLRLPDRRRGFISPGAFIPLAERTGLINAIGAWVLRTACREAATWPGPATVSVNVSPRQLHDGALLGQVTRALGESGLAADRLELELTESMLIDFGEDLLFVLSALRDQGIGLALDDFGVGFASLATLRKLPLTVMKLDRSLVRGLPSDREDAAIVRAVVATGHALGLTVVGEGIETVGQRDFLAAIGTDQGQGYLFSRPVPAAELRQMLRSQGASASAAPRQALTSP
ncbi:MAG: EAL domain-containing protein [Alphaproteobacteria bacterium]|nr:EAL domain-containing protein [Alphaproteobacteria bacterium]